MPLSGSVVPLSGTDVLTEGQYLRAMAEGTAETADLVAVSAEPEGGVRADPDLDAMLGMTAGDAAAAAGHTG